MFICASCSDLAFSLSLAYKVDLLYFKSGADVGIDTIIMPSIVDFGIDQVGETWCSINDNLLAARPHCTTPIEL